MEIYTLPDFFAVRYGGVWPRRLAAIFAILCSFTYLVAQIYGVGLISSRLTGVQFEIGVMLGLGGVLVCSFLGGMRAVTWTQVAQYVILILAFLIPVSWLAFKQLGNPASLLVYGQQLEKIAALEKGLMASPAELSVVTEYARRAAAYGLKLQDVEQTLAVERAAAVAKLERLKTEQTDAQGIQLAARELSSMPKTVEAARERWGRAQQDNSENRFFKRHVFVPTGTESPALGGTPGSSLGGVGLAGRTLRSRDPAAGPENRLDIGQTRTLRGPSPGCARVMRGPSPQPGGPDRLHAAC